MSDILIRSRITQPGLAGSIVHRSRLLDLLKSNIDKSLLLICTSAGFGKTTLANDFLSSSGLKHAWYYATSDINSFYSFFAYIVHSLKAPFPDFGKNTMQLITTLQKDATLSRDYKGSIEDSIGTFSNEFGSVIKEDIILVIDDLHNIEIRKNGDWLNYFFDILFDNLPPNLHLLVTTRDMPQFNISKLKAKRRIFLLSSNDLIFDDEEISELLEREYSIHSTEDEIKILQSNIHGWITGIHLVLQAYGREFKNLKPGFKKNYTDIFNYFAKDIFDYLDDRTRDFLLNTAILENFNLEICNYLLDIDYSGKIINELINKNIFIELAGPQSEPDERNMNYYNYQELFKLFLITRLNELKTKEEINCQFKKLFSYYLERNDMIPAINCGLKTEDYETVIPLIIQNHKTIFENGNYETLWNWINVIPISVSASSPHILYLTGLLFLYFHSDPEKSLEYLNEALKISNRNDDIHIIVDCNVLKIDASLLTGKYEDVKDELKELLKMNITPEESARLLYQISRVLYREGSERYDEMIKILTEAIDICNKENLKSFKTDLFSMLGHVYSDWGDTVKAAHYYEQALGIHTDVYKMFRTINHIIELHSTIGDYAKAKEYLDRSTELCSSFPSLLFKRYLLRSCYILRLDIGDFEESVRILEELNTLEIRNNIKHYAGLQYIFLGEACYHLKKYDSALKYLEISLSYIDKNNEFHLILNSYIRALVSLKTKMNGGIEKVLLDTLEFNEKNKILFTKVQIELQLANYYLSSGSKDTAMQYLKSCLDISAYKQYLSLLELEVVNSRPLFDLAILNNIQKQFVKTIFENVRNKLSYEWLSDECKKRLAEEIEGLTDLKLYSFGKTEIWLRGQLIEEGKWIRKKSKVILAYLLTKPEMILNKDKIVDIFLQDVPSENIDTIFHNTISNIRSAVKIIYEDYTGRSETKSSKDKDISKHAPQLVLYESKNLSLNRDYYYAADCIEFDKLFDTANSASSKPKQKIEASVKAIELYKGEFMPGNYESWCEEMRENYLNMYQKLCENLINLFFSSGDHQNTIKYAEKLLETDKLHPEAYLRIIESHVKLNNINAARNKFALMLRIYDEELGEKPEKPVLNKINDLLGSL